MRHRHILIYFEQYSWGGTDTHLENLLYGWPNRTDKFTILCNRENSGIDRIIDRLTELGNVKVKKFSSLSREGFLLKFSNLTMRRIMSLLSFPFFWLFWLFQFIQAFQEIKELDPVNVFLSNNGGYPGGWGCNFSIVASFYARVPLRILLIHHQATGYRRLLEPIERFLDELFFKKASHVVVVSEATKKTILNIRNFPSDKVIDVIYNGIEIDPEQFSQAGNIRHDFDAQEKVLIGIMGVIERYKGHEDLVKALTQMSDHELHKIKVLIIGKGEVEEVEYLKSLMTRESVRNAVTFTGYIKGNSQSIISQLDLMLVMTKDFEGFGLTLAEAMSVNVPVIATRVGAIPEFVFHEKNGYLVDPSSPDQVANALKFFLSSQQTFLNYTEEARLEIQKYSIQRLGSEFHHLMEE